MNKKNSILFCNAHCLWGPEIESEEADGKCKKKLYYTNTKFLFSSSKPETRLGASRGSGQNLIREERGKKGTFFKLPFNSANKWL
jgi:hypothetical protein